MIYRVRIGCCHLIYNDMFAIPKRGKVILIYIVQNKIRVK